MAYDIKTVRGYSLYDVASTLQKSIRRSDAKTAGYFAIEMFESKFADYAWRRLLTVSAEDCFGVITHEIVALYDAWKIATKGNPEKGRIFLAKATILLCQVPKSRDADHLTNLVYDKKQSVDDDQLLADLEASRLDPMPIPDYAYDIHTKTGRQRGKTKDDFFVDEFRALKPRQPGLFDDLIPDPKNDDPEVKPGVKYF